MNILFLSINVPSGNKRDQITYNFIWKEMKYLALRGYGVYYLSELSADKKQDGIYFISKSAMLERNTFLRRIKNLVFALKECSFLHPLLIESIRDTLHVCGFERACIKSIRKFNISVIHTHFFEPSGEAAVLSAKVSRVPLLATLHGAEIQKMPEFDYGACMSKFYETALRNSIGSVDFFTAPNRFLCQKLHDDFGVLREKIEYVPNGVEEINFKKDIRKINEKIVFISICNMIKLKNLDIIFESIGCLLEKFKFKLLIVGSGPLKERYERMVGGLSRNNVIILEEMPKDKLFNLMSQCDCLIHSSFSEGMPTVVLEALSIGIPCLVSNIPAHQELICDGINGFLFDPYSRNDFIEKMRFILSNKSILANMKNNCINSVKKYSIESKIDSYIRIYNKLLVPPYTA
jgi:glycosyltransferase involved in cell wall biosynthesis